MFLTIGNLLPFEHALDASRAVMADGAGLGDIATDLYWIGAYAFGATVLAVVSSRSRMID